MARGRIMTDQEKKILSDVILKNQDSPAKTIRKEFRERLKAINPDIDNEWPGIRLIQKEATTTKRKIRQNIRKRLDEPWSLGCITDDLIAEKLDTPDVVPLLLEIQEHKWRFAHDPSTEYLSIREAFWISKLYKVILSPELKIRCLENDAKSLLCKWASIYATEQRLYEINDNSSDKSKIERIPFDTSRLDRMIVKYPEQYGTFPADFEGLEMSSEIEEYANKVDRYFEALKLWFQFIPIREEMRSEEEKEILIEAEKTFRSFRLNQSEYYRKQRSNIRLQKILEANQPREFHLQDYNQELYDEIEKQKENIRNEPEDPNLYCALGELYYQQQNFDDAEQMYRKAIDIDWNHTGAHCGLGSVCLAQERRSEAIKEYSYAIRIEPKNPSLHVRLGELYEGAGDSDSAKCEYEDAIAIDPNNAEAHSFLGYMYRDEKQYDDAVKEFKEAINFSKGQDIILLHQELGEIYRLQGNLDDTEIEYKMAISLRPDDFYLHGCLGDIFRDQKKPDDAQREYAEARRLRSLIHNKKIK